MNPSGIVRRSRRRRRASMYVAVLGAALIVTVIGVCGLVAVRVEHRASAGTNDFAAARLHAWSAIEMGLLWIENDPNWRNARPNGVWATDVPVGDGAFTLEAADPDDADLGNSASDPLVLTGIGVQGASRYKLQVTLLAEGEAQGLSCLGTSLHAGNDVTFDGALVNGDQIISANHNVVATSSIINPAVEASNTATGGMYPGGQTQGVPQRTMPDPVTVFDFYIDPSNGTPIAYASLTKSGPAKAMQAVVLSPASNPYGAQTNAQGIYSIDCGGQSIRIQNCRVVGTLVLVNPGSGSYVGGSVHFEPAVANYPTLMVDGGLHFQFDGGSPLSEASVGVNFNPTGSPYNGEEDTVLDDTYPSVINGLVYVSNDGLIDADSSFDGVVVIGNNVQIQSTSPLTLTYQATFLNNPPPGFGGGAAGMVISPESWRRAVD
jgi:hypothetical protein